MDILTALKAPPDSEVLIPNSEVNEKYRYWRIRTMYSIFIGYAVFYFVRKNLSALTPLIIQDLGFTKTQMGTIWSVHYLLYGFGKFGNGILGDRANPRYFMALGLIFSAGLNIWFGFSSTLLMFTIVWALNGWIQSMGSPVCARSLTHWYSRKELGTYWGIWNISHQVGGAAILVLAGYLGTHYGWRWGFYVPAAIAIVTAFFIVNRLRDTPASLGLPPIEKFKGDTEEVKENEAEDKETEKKGLLKHVLSNPAIWFLALGNFFVYIVRYGAMDWAPTFLVETKGADVGSAARLVASFEIMGIFGSLLAGYLSDKYFKGRRGPLNVIYMALLVAATTLFWINPIGHQSIDFLSLSLMGFLVYGPQMLVGVAAADLVSKKAAGTATGFTGLGGYLGGIVSGAGAGMIVDKYGWNGGFTFFIGCAVAGAICFLFTWNQHRSNNKRA